MAETKKKDKPAAAAAPAKGEKGKAEAKQAAAKGPAQQEASSAAQGKASKGSGEKVKSDKSKSAQPAAPEAVEETGGLKLEPHEVVLRPLVTEKGVHRSDRNNQYAFEINGQATKQDVRGAVESLFNVRVLKVRTQTRKGKTRRYRFRMGETKGWKKAVVTLHKDDKISFF